MEIMKLLLSLRRDCRLYALDILDAKTAVDNDMFKEIIHKVLSNNIVMSEV